VRTFRVRAHARPLAAAMRRANPSLSKNELSQEMIEVVLDD
jgi:hypothetical protein